jgi:hypothetical protein
MFGKLTIHAATAARNILLGGATVGTSTIAGVIAPGTSMWEMVAIAAIGLAKETPKTVEILVESITESRTMAGSSISYISKMSHL